jgi:hypothetical protein
VDFDLSPDQLGRVDRLRELAAGAAVPSSGLPGSHDQRLADSLSSDASLVGPDLEVLDRILLVEEAARLGLAISPTALLLLGPLCGIASPPGPVAIVAGPRRVLRDGAAAAIAIDVGGPTPRVATVHDAERIAEPSGLLESAGAVTPTAWAETAWACSSRASSVYRLGLAAEIAGAAHAAIARVADYLNERVAFGQPLGALQALRHRLSERAVDAAGASALVHCAAFHLDEPSIAAAVAYATSTAAAAPPELHQLCGARGFVVDFGLSRSTMLMQALRVELGGTYDSAAEYAGRRWAG